MKRILVLLIVLGFVLKVGANPVVRLLERIDKVLPVNLRLRW